MDLTYSCATRKRLRCDTTRPYDDRMCWWETYRRATGNNKSPSYDMVLDLMYWLWQNRPINQVYLPLYDYTKTSNRAPAKLDWNTARGHEMFAYNNGHPRKGDGGVLFA